MLGASLQIFKDGVFDVAAELEPVEHLQADLLARTLTISLRLGLTEHIQVALE